MIKTSKDSAEPGLGCRAEFHFRRPIAEKQFASHQGSQRVSVRFPAARLGEPVERLEFGTQPVPEPVPLRNTRAEVWPDAVVR